MGRKVVVLRLPVGSQHPGNGYEIVQQSVTTRGGKGMVTYKKTIETVDKVQMDELADLFGRVNVAQQQGMRVDVTVGDEDQLKDLLGGLTIGELTMSGGRRSRRMKKRGKSRKHYK
jgi:hypothetical protein